MKFSVKAFLASGATAILAATPLPSLAATGVRDGASAGVAGGLLQSASYHRGWRHRDRVDAGDILTGIGILAGIAIIADAASKSDRSGRSEPRYDDRDYNRPEDRPTYSDNDLGAAVTLCTNAAEQSAGDGARVREISSVTSQDGGWRVQGQIDAANARSFDCTAVDGRVDYVRLADSNI